MKYVFFACFGILVAASAVTVRMMPDQQSKVPVIYWVTDPNPAREEQIRIYQEWLKKHHYPEMELRLDTANRQVSKMVIQGVSGVGGDVMDIGSGAGLRYFHAVGLLADMTEAARELNFGPGRTYSALEPEITLDGRQYMFPCNVYAQMLWANKATFRKYGLPVPPRKWDIETFERMGKAFVKAANPKGRRQTVFFANGFDTTILRRSMGLSIFNETGTRCILDDERNVKALELVYKWTYEDRILPSAADLASFASEAGYGGLTLQLFNNGNYAMFWMGRYALIQLRKFGALELSVSFPPYIEFPNTRTGTRAGAVYAGSKHPELAKYFLSYLASEDYNQQIVADADALPPNPIYTETEAFKHPKKYPNEWGVHEPFAEAANTIAIGGSYSPFLLPSTMNRIGRETDEGFMSGIYSAEEAAKSVAERANAEITRSLEENPKLRPLYDQLTAVQEKIEARRDRGGKVPEKWIRNPFYVRYYRFKGWLE